ncbi:MAG: DUF6077 domain-containing protein, partial [Rubrobacteraceae bacterium]
MREIASTSPLLLLFASFTLFAVPGALLTSLLLREAFPGLAGVPIALALSIGIFGLPGSIALLRHWSIGTYLIVCGLIVSAFLILGTIASFRYRSYVVRTMQSPTKSFVDLLWVPFVGLMAVLSFTSFKYSPPANSDEWIYMAWTREFLGENDLASRNPFQGYSIDYSRVFLDVPAWLLEHATLSLVSDTDAVELVLAYLNSILVVTILLAFYALARTLFENRGAALLISILAALLHLT